MIGIEAEPPCRFFILHFLILNAVTCALSIRKAPLAHLGISWTDKNIVVLIGKTSRPAPYLANASTTELPSLKQCWTEIWFYFLFFYFFISRSHFIVKLAVLFYFSFLFLLPLGGIKAYF